jgi:hypothetical protein
MKLFADIYGFAAETLGRRSRDPVSALACMTSVAIDSLLSSADRAGAAAREHDSPSVRAA